MPVLANARHERFYVYVVRICGRTRYVGKGCGSRYKIHLTRSHNEALASEVQAAVAHGEPVRVRIVKAGLSERQALQIERRMIAKWGGRVTNVSAGGRARLEVAAMACRANIRQIKSQSAIIADGARGGFSIDDRLAIRADLIDRLSRLARMAEVADGAPQ